VLLVTSVDEYPSLFAELRTTSSPHLVIVNRDRHLWYRHRCRLGAPAIDGQQYVKRVEYLVGSLLGAAWAVLMGREEVPP